MQYIPSVIPEQIHQQFNRSLKLYFKALSHVIFFALLFSIIVFIPRLTMLAFHQEMWPNSILNWNSLLLLVVDIGALILFTSMLWRIKCRITGRHESFFDDLMMAVKKIPQILIAVLIQVLVFVLINTLVMGFYFLIKNHAVLTNQKPVYALIGGTFLLEAFALIYIYFLFFFYLALILTEDQTALSALKKSVMLVWKNWWRTFCVQLLPWVTYFIVLLIIAMVFDIEINIYFFQSVNVSFLIVLLQILLFAVFIPWPAATMLVQLRDLELRKNL